MPPRRGRHGSCYGDVLMTLETVLLWAFVGLIAGWLASRVAGSALGVVGDIIVGIVGAFVGGLLFRELHWTTPFSGLPGTIFVAFVGAVLLLIVLRVVRRL
jgi:uncharacterized membrane protein YeaQ/YmgE (transglycosylase-associated protein family)